MNSHSLSDHVREEIGSQTYDMLEAKAKDFRMFYEKDKKIGTFQTRLNAGVLIVSSLVTAAKMKGKIEWKPALSIEGIMLAASLALWLLFKGDRKKWREKLHSLHEEIEKSIPERCSLTVRQLLEEWQVSESKLPVNPKDRTPYEAAQGTIKGAIEKLGPILTALIN